MGKNHNNIVIRVLNEVDLLENSREFIDLLNENFIINFPDCADFSEQVSSNYNDMVKFTKEGSAYIIGALIKETVVGFLWGYKRVFLGKSRLHISHIVVSLEYRGLGLGTRMINHIEKLAMEKNIKVIELITSIENKNTIEFYNNYGFSITRVQFEKNLGDNNDNQ